MAGQYDKRNKRVFLSLGSNLDDRVAYLREAIQELESDELSIIQLSSVYESEPWGAESLNPFFNMVIEVNTSLEPLELLSCSQKVEKIVGRKSKTTKAYENRVIDIDILYYDNQEINSEKLIIPHKHLKDRRFVLEPFKEIAADLCLGNLNNTVEDLFHACKDTCNVLRLSLLK